MYSTYQIRIKKGHRFFEYCEKTCTLAKNLYNSTNFYIRQIYTAYTQDKELQPLQQEVCDQLFQHLPQMNQVKVNYVAKLRETESRKPLEKRKEISDAILFQAPSKKNAFVGYALLDALFKAILQPDYVAMPGQVNQQIMRVVFQNWKSIFASIHDFKLNPTKYTGKPRIPRYVPKNGMKECTFSNQVCKVKEDKYLKFPGTKEQLNIGKLGKVGGLQQVRILPQYGEYIVEVVTQQPDLSEKEEKAPQRILEGVVSRPQVLFVR